MRDTDSINQEDIDIAQDDAVAIPPEHRSFWSMFATYWKALFMPTPRTFAEEKPYATWRSVFSQLAILLICVGAVSAIILIQKFIHPISKTTLKDETLNSITSLLNASTSLPAAIFQLVFLPVSFFFFMIFQFLFAKSFRGVGRFVEQCYTTLLYYAPFTMIATVLGAFLTIFPFGGNGQIFTATVRGAITLIFLALSLIINVPALMGVHRISKSQATIIIFSQIIFACLIVVITIFVGGSFLDKYLRSLN